MDLSLVLLFGFLSVAQLSQAQTPIEEEKITAINVEPLGGWTEAHPERQDVLIAAKKAVEKFNTKSKAKKYFKLLEIASAHTQVTNMINFRIEANIGKTKCLKTEPVDLENCALGRKLVCEFEVEFNPRNDQYNTRKMSCRK